MTPPVHVHRMTPLLTIPEAVLLLVQPEPLTRDERRAIARLLLRLLRRPAPSPN